MADFGDLELRTDYHVDKDRYIPDDSERLRRLWENRVKRYFSGIYREALDYRVNDDDSGVKVLEDDGTIIEITINKGTSVAMARLCPSDEPWSFED